MVAALVRAIDDWCAQAELRQQLWPWLVGVAIVAPLAAWAALAVMRGVGGLALAAPRCLKCRHLNVAGASERCTECGRSLADGTAWTRRKPRLDDSLRGLLLAACIVATGLAMGGVAYMVMTSGRRAADSMTTIADRPLADVLRGGTSMEIAQRLGLDDVQATTPEAQRRLVDAIELAVTEAPSSAGRFASDPAFGAIVGILGEALQLGVMSEGDAVSYLDAIGGTPRVLVPQVLASASRVPIPTNSRLQVYAWIREVQTFVDAVQPVERSRPIVPQFVAAPAGPGRAVIVVSWDLILRVGVEPRAIRLLARRTSTFDVLVVPGAPTLVVAAAERERASRKAPIAIGAVVRDATIERVGANALLHVSMATGSLEVPSLAMVGRWTATLHHASGDAARDVSFPLRGHQVSGDFVGLLPSSGSPGDGPPPYDAMTLSFEPDATVPVELPRWYAEDLTLIASHPWRSGRVPVERRGR
jgi:hypothetical protein